MSKGLERRLELLKNRALSDLDSIPTTAISICEKSNEEVMEAYETIKQVLQRLEAIYNAKPSEALKYVNGKIADLEDDLQHYTMVEKDKCKEFFIREDLKQFTTIKQTLLNAQELEKENQELIKKLIVVCGKIAIK